ncbi:MAG: HAD family phosphatase [Rhodospirillaceae bacterium]|nr:HAD family phosphatase [Rhodospirillaceae bacterium]
MAIDAVIFDFGGVLVDWSPDYLYRELIPDPAERCRFLTEICSPDWNAEQDRGRSWEDAIAERAALYPDHAPLIRAFRERWHEMLAGPIEPAVDLVARLHQAGVSLYGLTNWSAETYEIGRPQMPFLPHLHDVVVSGVEKLAKPDPRIFHLLLDRNGLIAANTAFVDDNEPNIHAATAIGLHAIHHRDVESTEDRLRALGLAF